MISDNIRKLFSKTLFYVDNYSIPIIVPNKKKSTCAYIIKVYVRSA